MCAQANSAFHPSWYANQVAASAGVKAGRVHFCRVQAMLCDTIWQLTPRSSVVT